MPGGFAIPLHRAFRYLDRRIVYRGRARDAGLSYLFEDAERIQVRFEEGEFARLRAENALTDWIDPAPIPGEGGKLRMARVSMNLANEAELCDARRKQDYCLAWAAERGIPRSERGLPPVIARVHARRVVQAMADKAWEPPPPCPSSVQKWIHDWLEGDRTLDALVSQDRMKGNRHDRLAGRNREYILQALDEHYLTTARNSVAKVHQELKEKIKALNKGLPPGGKLPVPSYDSVLNAVKRLCPFTVDFCRKGASHAKEKWRAVAGGYVTTHANEVWEIDDTRADMMCVGEDRETVIGRPWLTVVIDRHTRMIMAFVISFSPPDTATVLEALRIAMLPKEAWLAKHGVQGSYLACGRPGTVHVDNGKHYNSRALTRGLECLGINHRTMPVLKAWYKGTVERLIGTISRQVFHTVPGTTFSGIYERDRETAPETVATMTVDELRTKLLHWVVNQYQHRHHKGIDDKPSVLWKISMASHEQEVPLTGDTIESALSPTVTCTLRKDGLQFRNLKYHSEHVLEAYMLPKAERQSEVVVRVDRENLEEIRFLHPVTGVWHPAYLRKDLVPRVRRKSLEEYEIACAIRRSRPDEFGDNDPDFVATYAEAERANRKLGESGKLGDKVKAEAARERALKRAAAVTEPDQGQAPAPGEDLSSLVDREAESVSDAAPPRPATPQAAARGVPFDPAAWGAANGLSATVSTSARGATPAEPGNGITGEDAE